VLTESFCFTSGIAGAGHRYALWHAPRSRTAHSVVVHVHAFAEEMHKARRMVALQARRLAAAGCAVLQVDLQGCGDSEGDFGDASWEGWLGDVREACDLALLRHRETWPSGPEPRRWLWGLRAGCLIASAVAAGRPDPWNLLYWQPPPSGRHVLQQFLRLKAVAAIGGDDSGSSVEASRARLAHGHWIDVAGYRLSPSLAQGLEHAGLAQPPSGARAVWLELSQRPAAGLLPASAACLERWRAAGCEVESEVVSGPAFWCTAEIEDAPQLLTVTARRLAAETCLA
jgi:exosortase A-associated hydrolase 2